MDTFWYASTLWRALHDYPEPLGRVVGYPGDGGNGGGWGNGVMGTGTGVH